MTIKEFTTNLTVNNPLTTSLFVEDDPQAGGFPADSKSIITESGLHITTESGDALITES